MAPNRAEVILAWFGPGGRHGRGPDQHRLRTAPSSSTRCGRAQPRFAVVDAAFAERFAAVREAARRSSASTSSATAEPRSARRGAARPRLARAPFAELAREPSAPRCPRSARRTWASVFFTSGTTGPSKGVAMPHAPDVLLRREVRLADPADRRRHLPDGDAAVPRQRAVHGGLPGADRRRALRHPRRSSAPAGGSTTSASTGVTVTNFVGVMMDFVWKQPPRPDDADNELRCVYAAPTASSILAGVHGAVRHRGVRRCLRPDRDVRADHVAVRRDRPAGRGGLLAATGSRSGWSTPRPTRRSRSARSASSSCATSSRGRAASATTGCRRRPSRPGATCGSTPATRCAGTRTAGTTSSTATRTRCAAAARTSAPTRSSRPCSGTRRWSSAR